MARLITEGFEPGYGDPRMGSSGPTITDSTGTIGNNIWQQNGDPNSGHRTPGLLSSQSRSSSDSSFPNSTSKCAWTFTGANGTTYYARVYIFIYTFTSTSNMRVMSFNTGTSVRLCSVFKRANGRSFHLADQAGTIIGSASGDFNPGEWVRLDLAVRVGTGATDYAELRCNNTLIASTTTGNFLDVAPGQIEIGAMDNAGGSGSDATLDDFALNDSTGASETSWPGGAGNDCRIYETTPISDNAAGSTWALGDNSAIGASPNNATNSVDNRPPEGVVDSTVAGNVAKNKQIRNATSIASGATSQVDLNCEAPQDAGINQFGVTVNSWILAMPFAWTGAPVATSPAAGALQITANPAQGAELNFGNFYHGSVVAGTWPNGWITRRGTITYAPSVSLSTNPVVRIGKRTASTRIAMVSAVGVVYEAAVTPPQYPKEPPVTKLQAVRQASLW